jgi:hypothetical protein
MTIRDATPDDYPLIEKWAMAHGRATFDPRTVPPTAFMVEDHKGPLVFCKLYLSLGVGVAFLEGLFSRPWESPSVIVAGVAFMVEGVKKIAEAHDYGMLVCHTFPCMARKALGMGFTETQSGLVQMVVSTREVSNA